MSTKDPKDFGPTPTRAKNFKLPDTLPSSRPELLALVSASGLFPPKAARWLAPRELRALLVADFPIESSTILSVREPRQIANVDDLLALCADRRVAYYAEMKERREAKAKVEATEKDAEAKVEAKVEAKPKAPPKPTAAKPTAAKAPATKDAN